MQSYAASVQGACIRVGALTTAGTPVTGTNGAYVMSAFLRVGITPEYESGDEVNEKAADGTLCVTYKSPDLLKRVSLELTICEPDPELTAILTGGTILTDGSQNSIGWAAPSVGSNALPQGASLEVWSFAVQNGKRVATGQATPNFPYYRWVFPYVQMRPTSARVIENGVMANVFTGYGFGNTGFGAGPGHDWTYTSTNDRAFQYARDNNAPIGTRGYVTV